MRKIVSFFGDETPEFVELNIKAKEYAKSKGFEYVWAPQNPFDYEDVIVHLREADAGIIDTQVFSEPVFSRINESCRLLIRFGVGFDKVDLPAASKYNICVARTTGTLSNSVADMALSLILACRRQHMVNRATVESGIWKKNIGSETFGKTIGILGFGAIGQRLAALMRGFECEILVYDPYLDEAAMSHYNAKSASLEEIFSRADAISLHMPYTPQSHHMIGRAYRHDEAHVGAGVYGTGQHY